MKFFARTLLPLLLSAATGLLSRNVPFAQAQPPTDSSVRAEAVDLLRLAEFVEWPEQPDTRTLATFNFCILGQDPFGQSLDDSVLGRSIAERQTMVVRGSRLGDMGHCDVVFVSSSESKDLPKILRVVQNKKILTVGQTADFAASGGIIQLLPTGDRIGFAINTDAAKRAGLTIRAPLLALARIVHDQAVAHEE
jgi:hypothetical protein